MTQHWDIVVVGAGMAGLSLAAELARDARVLVIEAEAAPGYHATGRSVAFWTESYGGPGIQPLTTISGPMLAAPDAELSAEGFLHPRGALHIGGAVQGGAAREMARLFGGQGVTMRLLDREAMAARVPGLRPEWTVAVEEPSCCDVDAAALLAACRALFLRRGGDVRCGSPLLGAERQGGGWRLTTGAGEVRCGIVVDAAGAWADEVAAMCGVAPIGIAPLRRTVVQLRTDPLAPADLPLVLDIGGGFYFKPAGGDGRIWLSPHDEVPDRPGDVAPDELGVAEAIARFEAAVDWRVEAVERKWAGLRSFAPDRLPVYGFDPAVPGFFWFAGQGGFGIQTAPAAALIGAALATGTPPDPRIAHLDLDAYSPERFAR